MTIKSAGANFSSVKWRKEHYTKTRGAHAAVVLDIGDVQKTIDVMEDGKTAAGRFGIAF